MYLCKKLCNYVRTFVKMWEKETQVHIFNYNIVFKLIYPFRVPFC